MGIKEWFVGVHFSWPNSLSFVLVHLNQNQLGFASNLVKTFFCKAHDVNPLATTYQSGIPVNSIAPLMDAGNFPTQTRRTQAYQSLIDIIGWLAMTTCPDSHSFLSSYNANQQLVT